MTVYLLHLERPHAHARHYIGWSQNLPQRLRHHRNGTGARFMAVQTERGNRWVLARTWPGGTRTMERQIKNGRRAPRLCPVCKYGLRVCYGCGKMYKTERWYRWHMNHAHPIPNGLEELACVDS